MQVCGSELLSQTFYFVFEEKKGVRKTVEEKISWKETMSCFDKIGKNSDWCIEMRDVFYGKDLTYFIYAMVVLDIMSFINRYRSKNSFLERKSKAENDASDRAHNESTQQALISTKRRIYNLDRQCHRPFSCKKVYLKEYLCFACPQALSSSLCFLEKPRL